MPSPSKPAETKPFSQRITMLASEPTTARPSGSPALPQRLPHAHSVPGGHVDLEAELAGVSGPCDPGRGTGDRRLAHRHEGKGIGGEVRTDSGRLQNLPRLRAAHADVGPLRGDDGEIHPEPRPLELQQPFQVLLHVIRRPGTGEHPPAVLGEAEGDSVVQEPAVLAQHPAEPATTDGQVVPSIRMDPVEKDGHVRTVELELAERRAVVHAGGGPAGKRLARDGLLHALAVTRKEARPPVPPRPPRTSPLRRPRSSP